MTKMKHKTNVSSATRRLAACVGDFMRYWGFRRIHGQLWLQVYLSPRPLSGAELTRRLRVSKALVSPALADLVKHKLVREFNVDGKTKNYQAEPDVFSVIQSVLREREAVLLAQAYSACAALGELNSEEIDRERLEIVRTMIHSAEQTLELLIV